MPDSLPLFPLGTVLFPGMVLPLQIFEQRYRAMFAERAETDPIFGVVLIQAGREVRDQPEINMVGTAASLLKAVRYADGRVDLAVRGGRRFQVLDGHWGAGYLTATVDWLMDDGLNAFDADAARLAMHIRQAFGAYLDTLERTVGLRIERPELEDDPLSMAYTVCAIMPFDTSKRQRLLEAATPLQLLADVLVTLKRERDLLMATGIGGAVIDHPGSGFSTN